MTGKCFAMSLVLCLSCAVFSATFEHAVFDSMSLDGEWEMSYSPYAHRTVVYPEFKGVLISKAIPGYWEDMQKAFRAAGMTDRFRINPWYEKQSFPIAGQASDTTLPDIYGCFYYRRTVEMPRKGRPYCTSRAFAARSMPGSTDASSRFVPDFRLPLSCRYRTAFSARARMRSCLPSQTTRISATVIMCAVSPRGRSSVPRAA